MTAETESMLYDLGALVTAALGYMTTDPAHYAGRVARRLGLSSDDAPETVAAELRKALCVDAPRWEALKEDLRTRIDQDAPVHRSFLNTGNTGAAAAYGGLLSAHRTTLAKMRELEG